MVVSPEWRCPFIVMEHSLKDNLLGGRREEETSFVMLFPKNRRIHHLLGGRREDESSVGYDRRGTRLRCSLLGMYVRTLQREYVTTVKTIVFMLANLQRDMINGKKAL